MGSDLANQLISNKFSSIFTKYRPLIGPFVANNGTFYENNPVRQLIRCFRVQKRRIKVEFWLNFRRYSLVINSLHRSDPTYSCAMRSFNDRVMDRSRAYLSPSQFEQFKKLLDNDVRRFELLIELAEFETVH